LASLHSNRGAKRAREAREALGFKREGPLPDLLTAVEMLDGVHVVVLELPDGVAGAYVSRPDCALLFVNGRQAIARQRFTLAHEFGHHRMGHASVVDEQGAISGFNHDPTEVCANAFAAEFLMPRDAIAARAGKRQPTLEDVVVLAYDYGVSAQAARYALESAKVLSDNARCDQLDEEIAAELHVELAAQLGLQGPQDELAEVAGRLPRMPAKLRDSVLGDLLAGAVDIEGAAGRSGRSAEELRAMLEEFGIARLLPTAA